MKTRVFLLKILMLTLLLNVSCAHKIPAPENAEAPTRYGPHATPLSQDFSYFQNSKSGTQFWKIMPYYKPQLTDCSCSAATAALVMNALTPTHAIHEETPSYSEERILELSGSQSWQKATRNGSTGLTLAEFNSELQNLFQKLQLQQKFTSSYFEMKAPADEKNFRAHLAKFNRGEGWLILLYGQGTVLGGPVVYPHFSPVGAYDDVKEKILMLDIDGTWYEPYWLPMNTVVKNLSTYDDEMKCQRGFIWVDATRI